MQHFEVHITGDSSIHSQAKRLGIKTIEVNLLNPANQIIRTEHMTSWEVHAESLYDCVLKVNDVLTKLAGVVRTKIECSIYYPYLDKALYIESHFKPMGVAGVYPLSTNKRQELLGTDRTYDKEKFKEFAERWKTVPKELCVCDTNPEMDNDWFKTWNL